MGAMISRTCGQLYNSTSSALLRAFTRIFAIFPALNFGDEAESEVNASSATSSHLASIHVSARHAPVSIDPISATIPTLLPLLQPANFPLSHTNTLALTSSPPPWTAARKRANDFFQQVRHVIGDFAMKRITYSRKNMSMAPDENGDSRKRRKTDSPSDNRPRSTRESTPGPSVCPKSKSHAKKPGASFSDEDEDMENDLAPPLCDSPDWKTKKKPSAPQNVLEKWSVKDYPVFKKPESTIYGEQNDYNLYMAARLKKREQMKKAELERQKAALAKRKRYSARSQILNDKNCLQGVLLNHQHMGRGVVNGRTVENPENNTVRKPATNSPTSMDHEESETSRMFDRIIKTPPVKTLPVKIPYVQKQYMATPTSAPFKNICQRRLRKDTKEAKLWSQNQSSSPLLCLPGELRNRIYDLVLGGQTICIEFETWRMTENNGHTALVPRFKYRYKVINAKTNPWAPYFSMAIKQSEGLSGTFTLLNGVCRQFYQETTVLPYKLNRWAFSNHLTMWNFLVVERRWTSAQRKAVEELIVSDHLPQQNLLDLLTGLKRALLACPLTDGNRSVQGWYSVEDSKQGRKLVKVQTSTLFRR